MKKMKKILAMLLAFAMVLGMTMTTMAAETGTITVNGLNANEETTVEIYQVITLNDTKNDWTVANWATSEVDKTANPATIDWNGLKEIIEAEDSIVTAWDTKTAAKDVTTVEFEDLTIGAYLIIATGTASEYQIMGAALYAYDETTNLIIAPTENPVVWAKYDDYSVTKTLKDGTDGDSDIFVGRGDEVQFEITTTFPSYEASAANRTFTITDDPEGLQITDISVDVGGATVTAGMDYTLSFETAGTDGATTALPADSDEAVTINFATNYIGTDNNHAGKKVVVTVTAIVTSDSGYSNTAFTDKAEDSSKVPGYTGNAIITKYGEDPTPKDEVDDKVTLIGAQFKVYEAANATAAEGKTPLYFVLVTEGSYKLATAAEIEASNEAVEAGGAATVTQTIEVGTNGAVQVTGLDEGTYWFDETKAPAGYSINEDGVAVTITANSETPANVSVTGSIEDTKLIALPSTGGIGTTIFTIAGCAIMIAAAFLFFASRRKENE